jgi:type II secretory pathway pseudopilin PulG
MRSEEGFTYVIAMLLVAALAVIAVRGIQITLTSERREKEIQLLEAGSAYYAAIKSYYDTSPGTAKAYPPTLEALLLDERKTAMQRHLRKLYRDPLTGSKEWGLVAAPGGGVMGVFSLSIRRPLKTGGFPAGMRVVENAATYLEWQFVYQPN